MNKQDTIKLSDGHAGELASQAAMYNELTRVLEDVPQCELDEPALEALDRILELDEGDLFFCEVSCLAYAAHVLAQKKNLKGLWLIPAYDGGYAFPRDGKMRYEEEMADAATRIKQIVGEEHQCFKGFASVPPDEPYKLLITTEAEEGVPTGGWPEMTSYFHHQLSETGGSREAVIYPPLDEQPESNSLREGNYFTIGLPWVVELSNGRIVIGHDNGSKVCRMVDLSDAGHPWEIEAAPFVVAACGGCLVPSMCRKCAGAVEETSLGELASRISRGTSLSRKALDPYPYKTVESTLVPIFSTDPADNSELPEKRHHTYRKSGSRADEGDLLFLDSSCINSDKVEPMFIDEIPKGQERYTVKPEDGEVLLISRNEKSFVFYKAPAPTLIANSVYVVWLNPDVDTRYLECWIEGSYAERWLKTAGKIFVDSRDPEPILSKGTLSSLPVPVFNQEIASQTLARKNAILHEIQKLYYEIGRLESKEAFAPASAMANPIEEGEARRIEKELSDPFFLWQE